MAGLNPVSRREFVRKSPAGERKQSQDQQSAQQSHNAAGEQFLGLRPVVGFLRELKQPEKYSSEGC